MEKVTLYIPTYNRSERLSKNLLDLFNKIKNENLYSNIDILVGDNCSTDSTITVLKDLSMIAKDKRIQFNYFVNDSNLGFNENVKQGYLRFQGEYIIFLSDDDNLISGALSTYLKLIFEIKPSVALINFNQSPFTVDSPLYTENKIFVSYIYDFFKPLILSPKLTGIALKKPEHNSLREEIASVIIPSYPAAHVALAIYQYSKLGKGLHVLNFIGFPDADYLEHITFLPYVSNLFRKELEYVLNKTGSFQYEEARRGIIDLISNRIVIDDSIYLLFRYFTFRNHLIKESYDELWSNCFRYFVGRSQSKSGLSLTDSSRKFKRTKILIILLLMIKNRIFRFLGLQHVALGEKGFSKNCL